MRGRPAGTTTTPGPCERCGREKRWRADARRAGGGYWTCSHRAPGGSRTTPKPRRSLERLPGPRRTILEGTRRWLTDPTVRVCPADSCFNDWPCPEHGR
jgi:hypothetical protein